MIEMQTVISTLVGIAVGALITWCAAKYYYEKASRDLAIEAKELKHLNDLMLRAMENAELATFTRDDEGNRKGIRFTGFGNFQGKSTLNTTGSINREKG